MMASPPNEDLLLALQLFDGKLSAVKIPGGSKVVVSYNFTPKELLERRRAVAKLLRRPRPPKEFMARLAAAFDPDEGASVVQTTIKLRGANAPNQTFGAAQKIVAVAQAHRQHTLEEAFEIVDQYFDTRGSAKSAWESKRWRALRQSIIEAFNPKKGQG